MVSLPAALDRETLAWRILKSDSFVTAISVRSPTGTDLERDPGGHSVVELLAAREPEAGFGSVAGTWMRGVAVIDLDDGGMFT